MKLATNFFLLSFCALSLWKEIEAACNAVGIGPSLVMFLGINSHVPTRGSSINNRRHVWVTGMTVVDALPGECDVAVQVDYKLHRRWRRDVNYSMVARFEYKWADDQAAGTYCITDVSRISGDDSFADRVRTIILQQPCVARRRRNLRGSQSDGLPVEEETFLDGFAMSFGPLEASDEPAIRAAFAKSRDQTEEDED